MTRLPDQKATGRALRAVLDDISQKYMADSIMLPLILCADPRQKERLRALDGLYQSAVTSIQFAQYRRAVWYILALSSACGQIFSTQNMDIVLKSLKNQISVSLPAST